jgi:multimeric flavodoxin WrbA
MGSASAAFKVFMEASSRRWMEQRWADKLAAGFTNSGSWNGDKQNTLVQFVTFAAQHGMLWVPLGQMPGNNSTAGQPGGHATAWAPPSAPWPSPTSTRAGRGSAGSGPGLGAGLRCRGALRTRWTQPLPPLTLPRSTPFERPP